MSSSDKQPQLQQHHDSSHSHPPFVQATELSRKGLYYSDLEFHYGTHTYHPIPVVLARGDGALLWDVDGKEYVDFLASHGAVNQGHNNEHIKRAMVEQLESGLTLTSRAFYNPNLGVLEKRLHDIFGYNKALPMNSGSEAVETAVKLARRWAYEVKKIPDGEATVLFAKMNYHGRTMVPVSASIDPHARSHFGPMLPGIVTDVEFGNAKSLEESIRRNRNVCAFVVEPILGEAGVWVPPEGYLKEVRRICSEHNILMIADEIQSGLGRTGTMLAVQHEDVRPDMVCLGKSLSGGFYPVSVVLADDEIMECMRPGSHGSTFGGNPMAARVAIAALEVLQDGKLAANAVRMGELFRSEITTKLRPELIKEVRGKGLMNAMELIPQSDNPRHTAWNLCIALRDNGVLCQPTHEHTLRLTPPLCITEAQMRRAIDGIKKALAEF